MERQNHLPTPISTPHTVATAAAAANDNARTMWFSGCNLARLFEVCVSYLSRAETTYLALEKLLALHLEIHSFEMLDESSCPAFDSVYHPALLR